MCSLTKIASASFIIFIASQFGFSEGRQLVTAYANKYGVNVNESSSGVDIMILAFLYPVNSGGKLSVKLGGALQGWHPPKASSLSGSGYKEFQDRGGKMFFALGGARFSSADWRMLIGKEKEFADALRTFCNAVDAHPNNDGVKISGIDLDYEDNAGIYNKNREYDGVSLMVQLSKYLKQNGFLVSHAPQGPYLCTPSDKAPECLGIYPGYLYVMLEGAKYIDYVWVQYYNNPSFNKAADAAKQVIQLTNGFAFNGTTFKWPANKLFVGKPGHQQDAGSGYIPAAQIGSEIFGPICKVTKQIGGTMFWEFRDGAFAVAVKQAMRKACG